MNYAQQQTGGGRYVDEQELRKRAIEQTGRDWDQLSPDEQVLTS
jgi:hypothetical protein